jgi:hypothetical protein
MITLETWIAIGSLAMVIMFIALMFSFYMFLIGPEGSGPEVTTDPGALLIQIISISGAPSLILAGTVLGISRGPVGRISGLVLLFAGTIMLLAMLLLINSTLPRISPQFHIFGIDYVPIIFIAGGIGIIACGLTTFKKRQRTRTDLDSELG